MSPKAGARYELTGCAPLLGPGHAQKQVAGNALGAEGSLRSAGINKGFKVSARGAYQTNKDY